MDTKMNWNVGDVNFELTDKLDELIAVMQNKALDYTCFVDKNGYDPARNDAERLSDWLDREGTPRVKEAVENATLGAGTGKDREKVDKAIDAVLSTIERIEERSTVPMEIDRWSDVVDWLYQLPYSLEDILESQGLLRPTADSPD